MMCSPSIPALILAPMEGVTDAPMRALVGGFGAFTNAVSEFLRVSQAVLTRNVFHRHVPELQTDCKTPTGLPVQVQLLGGHAGRVAESAVVAVEAGATAIDLNFGCPARTVNRHDGGATLLQYPARIREIVSAVRNALSKEIPVSVKLRLGWDNVQAIHENAAMAVEGGASWLTIHARTRQQGYAPPVDWPLVGQVRASVPIPVIANGDIWTIADFRRCHEETGCRHFMLGRGALADPAFPRQVAAELGIVEKQPRQTIHWPSQIQSFIEWSRFYGNPIDVGVASRIKQWLHLAAIHGGFPHFEAIKRSKNPKEIVASLERASQTDGSPMARRHAESWPKCTAS